MKKRNPWEGFIVNLGRFIRPGLLLLLAGFSLPPVLAGQIRLFDGFNGPVLNPIWQTNLPNNAVSGSFGGAQTATYLGAPNYGFERLGSNTVLRLTNRLNNLQRVGWGTATHFSPGDFYYDVRFNTLTQSPTTSIDGFIEIWILDAANSNRYDIVSPFGGSYDGAPSFFVGSSIDGAATETPFTYQNNTWYHLVLQGAPGQNIRASIYDDNGTELIGRTLDHGSAAFRSGFRLGLSQLIGYAQGIYPVDVAVDYVRLTGGSAPANTPPFLTEQPASQSVAVGGTAVFTAVAGGTAPLIYEWSFDGRKIPGANGPDLTLKQVQLRQGGVYALKVSNPYGSAFSSNALLTVNPVAPFITTQPVSQTVPLGGSVTFAVTAGGTPPLKYQWQFRGTNLPAGGTGALLTLADVTSAAAGDYAVIVSNPYGKTNSASATLTLVTALATGFFDDFNGPVLNPVWQTNLPNNAVSGSFGGAQTASYLGAPNYGLERLGSNTVLRLTNRLDNLQRVGWCTTSNFIGTNFYYDVRFNTLTQSPTTSIDGFIEIWILDAANSNRYDMVSPFGGSYDGAKSFFVGSSIDGAATETPFTYQNNTWYHLVLQSAPGSNIRASIYDDAGDELIGATLDHSAAVFNSGFKLGLSQSIGYAQGIYPADVAVDYVRLFTGDRPVITEQPVSQTVTVGGTAGFRVTAAGFAPISYQWKFNGQDLRGATNAALTLAGVQSRQAGAYSVRVANPYGLVLSSNARLTVNPLYPTDLVSAAQTVPQGVVTPRPWLSVQYSGTNWLVGWPAAATGFVLEAAASLEATDWVPVTNPPFQMGNQFVVPITTTDTNGFYRLRSPGN